MAQIVSHLDLRLIGADFLGRLMSDRVRVVAKGWSHSGNRARSLRAAVNFLEKLFDTTLGSWYAAKVNLPLGCQGC